VGEGSVAEFSCWRRNPLDGTSELTAGRLRGRPGCNRRPSPVSRPAPLSLAPGVKVGKGTSHSGRVNAGMPYSQAGSKHPEQPPLGMAGEMHLTTGRVRKPGHEVRPAVRPPDGPYGRFNRWRPQVFTYARKPWPANVGRRNRGRAGALRTWFEIHDPKARPGIAAPPCRRGGTLPLASYDAMASRRTAMAAPAELPTEPLISDGS